MRHPAFQSVPRLILYVSLCILTGLALSLCLSGLVQAPAFVLLLDGMLEAVLGGGLAYLLWFVVYFAERSDLPVLQRLLNHTAMLLLLLLIWVGGGYLLELLVFPSWSKALSSALPLKVMLGLLLFLHVLRLYRDWKRFGEQMDEEVPEQPTLPVSTAATKALESISVKSGQKIHLIQVSEILFLQAEGDYVQLHTAQGRFLKEQTMKYFEENLPTEHFVRIHRSCIVQVESISKIELYEKQNYRITLKSGHQLRASSSGYKQLKAVLNL